MRPTTRSLFAFLLSLATYVGGHYYNGRRAKALLFAALHPVVLVLSALFAHHLLVSLPDKFAFWETFYLDGVVELAGETNVFFGIITVAVAAVWLASALTAASDARRADPDDPGDTPLMHSLASVAMCGLGVLSIAAIALLWREVARTKNVTKRGVFWVRLPGSPGVLTFIPGLAWPTIDASPPSGRRGYLGITGTAWDDFDWSTQKTLAAGSGIIRGRVLVNNEPTSGVTLQLHLAPDLKTQMAASDANGYYSIRVPPGQYRLAGWELDYRAANTALAGKIDVDRVQHRFVFGRTSLAPLSPDSDRSRVLNVEADKATSGIDLKFVDAVVRTNPINGIHVDKDVVFEWEPYPDASYYTINFTDEGPNPHDHSYQQAGAFFHWGNQPIKATTTTAAAAGYTLTPGHYYSWHVEAHGAAGQWLSASGSSWQDFKVE